tara:strand:+ start:708 stop:944 length:237 start_codon:yes stop_codon:yes gene_type:complete
MTPNFFLRKEKMKNFKLRLLYVFFKICLFFKLKSTITLSIMLKYAPLDLIESFMQRVFIKDKETYDILHNYLRYIGRR